MPPKKKILLLHEAILLQKNLINGTIPLTEWAEKCEKWMRSTWMLEPDLVIVGTMSKYLQENLPPPNYKFHISPTENVEPIWRDYLNPYLVKVITKIRNLIPDEELDEFDSNNNPSEKRKIGTLKEIREKVSSGQFEKEEVEKLRKKAAEFKIAKEQLQEASKRVQALDAIQSELQSDLNDAKQTITIKEKQYHQELEKLQKENLKLIKEISELKQIVQHKTLDYNRLLTQRIEPGQPRGEKRKGFRWLFHIISNKWEGFITIMLALIAVMATLFTCTYNNGIDKGTMKFDKDKIELDKKNEQLMNDVNRKDDSIQILLNQLDTLKKPQQISNNNQ